MRKIINCCKRSVPLETFEVLRQNMVASGGGNFKSLNGVMRDGR
jgi:hypothetical protein